MQRDRLLLTEVIDAAERLVELTAERTAADFDADRDRRDALLWNFTVLGEAVAQLSEAFKGAHPDVAWSDPVRVRNRIVHGYWSVDLEVLVATARGDLTAFIERIRSAEAAAPREE